MEPLLGGDAPHTGIAALDLDGDRDLDLVAPTTRGKLMALRNTTERAAPDQARITFEPIATSAGAWRAAIAADLDLDGSPDLLGLPAADARPAAQGSPVLAWARNEGKRLSARELPVTLETPGVERALRR